MISTRRSKSLALAATIAALLAPLSLHAAPLYWDGGTVDLGTGDGVSQGGAGTWNTTILNWDQLPANSAHLPWTTTGLDEAIFGGTAGTVTLGVPILANRLTFNVGGYTIANGGVATNTLTLTGTAPLITVTNAGEIATISANLAGSALVSKAGLGTLVLSGTNNVNATGGTAITAGILQVGAVASLPGGGILLNGGSLRTTAAVTPAATQIITVGAAGGTLDLNTATKFLINVTGGLTGSGTFTRSASANNTLIGTPNVVQITSANVGFIGAVVLAGGQNEIGTNGFGNGLTAGNTITINSGAELTASNGTIPNALIINGGAFIGGDQGTSTFSGPITANGNFNVRLGDFFQSTQRSLIVSGGITSASAGAGALTFLNANSNTVTTGQGQTLFLNGDNSAYSGNVAIPAGFNVSFGTASSRGTGNLSVTSTATILGGIGVGYVPATQGDLPALTTNNTGANGGVFQINATGFNAALDLGTLYGSSISPTGGTNGAWFLGSGGTGSYTATSLGASNGVYRLGGGYGTLTITNGVLTGAANVIVGSTAAASNGTSTIVLAGANDYTGTTIVNAGSTLQAANNAALGDTATGTTVNAGGSLGLSGNVTVSEPLAVTGTSSTASLTNLTNGLVNVSGTNTYAGQINANVSGNNFRASVTAGTLNLSGNIIMAGGGTSTGFVFAGAGVINQTGVLSGSGSVFVTSGGTVSASTLNTYTGLTQFQNGTGTYNVASFNSVNGGTPLLASSSLGAPTTVAAGTLQFGTSTTAGAMTYTGAGETTDRVINLNGTTGGATLINNGTGLLKFTSDLTATGAGTKTLTLGGSSLLGEIAGVIPNNSGTNLTAFSKGGTGTWTLSGLNTYAGTTTVTQGALIINTLNPVGGGASSLGNPTTVANGTISLGGTTSTGTLIYVGTGSTSDRVINLSGTTGGGTLDMSGTGTFQVGGFTATGVGIKTVTLTGSTSGVGIVNGAIVNSTGNATAVTKSGTGTWTLNGANSYTGATTVNAGLLRVNGNSTAATGAVAVNAGASLGGTGTIGGAVTVNGNASLDLRDGAVGQLNLVNTLTLSGSATAPSSLRFDLGSTSVDTIVSTAAVNASTAGGALLTFNQLAGTPLADGPYTLISSSAASTVTGFSLATTRSGGRTYALTTNGTGALVQVTVGTQTAGPTAAVWGGTASTSWTDAGNWYVDPSSSALAGGIPSFGTNVSFHTTTATNLATVLNADFEINSLNFLSTSSASSIGGPTNALTIDATGANGNAMGSGINQLSAVTHTISARVGLAGSQTWNVAAGGGLTVSGLVFDTGAGFNLTKTGAGLLTLSGTGNTFTGDIAVTGGILAFPGGAGGAGDPLALGAGTKTITLTNNAVLRPTSTSNPTSTATKRFVIGAGGGTFDVPSGVTFQLDDATQFSGTGDLTVTGAGVVYLNNQAFSFSGNVAVNSGTLRLGILGVLGTAAGRTITVNTGGTLDANTNLSATTIPLSIVLNGGTLSTSATGSFAQAINLTANSIVSTGAGFTETLSGNITGGFAITKTGAGITVLSGTNSYAAASGASTIVTTGTLQAAKTASLPGYATAGQVSVASGSTLAFNVGGTGEFAAPDVTSVLAGGAFATGSGIGFDTTNAAGGTFSAPGLIPTPAVAVLNLTKLGSGTLALPVANGFGTGSTTVLAGTLSVTSGVNNTLGTGALFLGTSGGGAGNLDLGTTNQTVTTLTAQSNSATANTIAIGAGNTLTATGAVTIGVNTGGSPTTKLTVTGASGTLSIGTATTATNAGFTLGANTTDAFSNGATLDLSGLGTFYANLGTGTFRVGDALNPTGTATLGSTLILAANSTIRATNFTTDSPDSSQTQTIRLGSGLNTINATTIEIGGSTSGRSSGILQFDTTSGSLVVRNLAGNGRANFNVAFGNTGTGAAPAGTVNLLGHSADLLLSTLQIGGRINAGAGASTGTFSFDTGTLDATGIILARRTVTTGTNSVSSIGTLNLGGGVVTVGASGIVIANNSSTIATNPAVGTVNISGGAVTVGATSGTSITLGSSVAANGPATATLNITGGSLTVAGNIVKGTTTGLVTASLNLNGANAVLDMAGKVIGGAGAAKIDNVTFAAGTLKSLAEINGGAGLTKSGTGILILEGNNTYTGGTFDTAGTLDIGGGIAAASVNGSVSVSADATLGGTGTILPGSGGSVSVAAGGIVAPGASSIGTLTIDAKDSSAGALSLMSGASFTMELNTGVLSDRVAITHATTGSVVFAGNVINFSDLSGGSLVNGNYRLFSADTSDAFSGLTTDGNGFILSGLSIGSGLGAYGAAVLQVQGGDIVLTNIPEPGSAAMLVAGLASLVGLQRFRRRAGRRTRA